MGRLRQNVTGNLQRWFSTALICVLISACQARETQNVQSNPGDRITVSDVQEMVLGTRNLLDGILPTQVTVIPSVSRARAGNGYILKLNWTYVPPPMAESINWLVQWNLKILAGADDNSLRPIFLGGPEQFAMNSKLEWLNSSPIADKVFVFKLSALIVANASDGSVTGGEIVLKDIRLDLKGL